MDREGSTIQQAAQRTGLSAHTLRYYERIGLLDPPSRAGSGHRRYTERDLGWLTFLTRLRSTGMRSAGCAVTPTSSARGRRRPARASHC